MADAVRRQEFKLLSRIKNSIQAGNYYEAHQLIRTLYFRLKTQSRYKEALDVLYDGALQLCNASQIDSCADLSMLFVQLLPSCPVLTVNFCEEVISRICVLHSRFRHDHPDRANFVNAGVKWSSQVLRSAEGTSLLPDTSTNLKFWRRYGHPLLHRGIATTFWSEVNYPESRHHFLFSNDGSSCGKMLAEFHQKCAFSTEVDLFIVQQVFHYLCLRRLVNAKEAFEAYTTNHPAIAKSAPPFRLPLLNFVCFLFVAIEEAKLAVFAVICEQYEAALKRDPMFLRYLDKLGQLYFGLAPPQPTGNSSGGFLGGLISQLFAGGQDGEGEDDTDPFDVIDNAGGGAIAAMPDLD